jgi:hypothetical protein
MASLTFWNALVPQPRSTSLDESLAARVRDPAWMLARQRQLGEFLGVDGGSPAFVTLGARTTTTAATVEPLEPTLEHEPLDLDLASRVELGQIVQRLIEQQQPASSASLEAQLAQYRLTPPHDGSNPAFWAVCAGALDGAQLYHDIKQQKAPAAAALANVYHDFVAWVDDVFGPLDAAAAQWSARTLDYAPSIDVALPDGGNATLTATPDRVGDLEWYAFEVGHKSPGGAPAPLVITSVMPAHVRFRGMPNDRFWDFESNKTDYGSVHADVPDAGRLMFIDFMLVHGGGWFVAPLDVPVGGLCKLESVVVHDVFGGATAVPRADDSLGSPGQRSTLFSTTDGDGVAGFLFVAPTCAAAGEFRLVEDVRLFRDDASEAAWAVEELAPDALGLPLRGYDRGATASALPAPATLYYQLAPAMARAWFALTPQASQGLLTDFLVGDDQAALGRIVPALATGGVPEQAIPRDGLRVQRVVSRARWINGRTYLWCSRRKVQGARGAPSGLVFDRILSPQK